MINFKRLADEYRSQKLWTAGTAQNELTNAIKEVEEGRSKPFTSVQRYLSRWYWLLLEDFCEQELCKLSKVISIISEMSQIAQKEGKNLTMAHLGSRPDRAQKIFTEFVKQLPKIMEKALTRAIRESGIKLR